jgi:hypothetical protein
VSDDQGSKFIDEGDAEGFDIAGPALEAATYADARLVSLTKFQAPFKDEMQRLFKWTFKVPTDEGDAEVTGASSRMTGPNSKLVKWAGAILGRELTPNEHVDPGMLFNKPVQVVVEVKGGYSRVTDLIAMPRTPRAVRGPVQAPEPEFDLDAPDVDDLVF